VKKNIVAMIMLLIIGLGLMSVVGEMPTFGERRFFSEEEMYDRYLQQGPEETGSINIVSAIITDYRAFDTLGETTVLFATVAAIYGTLLAAINKDGDD